MASASDSAPTDLTAQVRRHLESLRAAGVDWLPASAPMPAWSVEEAPASAADRAIAAMLVTLGVSLAMMGSVVTSRQDSTNRPHIPTHRQSGRTAVRPYETLR